jgi:hypothetical protein
MSHPRPSTLALLFVLSLAACNGGGGAPLTRRGSTACLPGSGSVETWCDDAGACELRVLEDGARTASFFCSVATDASGCMRATIDAVEACRGGEAGGDGGTRPPGDGGTRPPGGPVATVAGGARTDFGCLGALGAPIGGAAAPITLSFSEAVSRATLPAGSRVDVFPGNRVLDWCAAPDCIGGSVDANGELAVELPLGGWYAFRVHEGGSATTEAIETLGYNRLAPTSASGRVAEGFVSRSTIGLIPMLYSRSRVPGSSIVSGAVYDCGGSAVASADVQAFLGPDRISVGGGASDPFLGLFTGSSPCPRCTTTDSGTSADPSVGARFALANLPSGAPVRIEIRATLAEGEGSTLVSCEEIDAAPDAVAILSMRPLRNDYPPGHGCNGRD